MPDPRSPRLPSSDERRTTQTPVSALIADPARLRRRLLLSIALEPPLARRPRRPR
jgi:hypothetical protein